VSTPLSATAGHGVWAFVQRTSRRRQTTSGHADAARTHTPAYFQA
jgi:hypothetical protein